MSEVAEYLQFNFKADRYTPKQAVSLSSFTQLNQQFVKLQLVNEKLGSIPFKLTGENTIPTVFRKTKRILLGKAAHQLTDQLERREFRVLSFALNYSEGELSSIYSNIDELELVLQAFDQIWRDTYLFGLMDCYLKSWEMYSDQKALMFQYIKKKLLNYKGERKLLINFKHNLKYFDNRNGDLILGHELAIKEILLNESTRYLSLPDHYRSYPYFSKVIISFYEKNKINLKLHINDLSTTLVSHNRNTTNKRLISKLIIQANSSEYLYLQDVIQSLAFKLIGDPGITANWLPNKDLSEQEMLELKAANRYLNEWITKKFITVFFETCINDSRRKAFWLKYWKEIKVFKVFGPLRIKSILLSDKRIAEFVEGRYHVVDSRRDVSAFMFLIGEYKFVEFSDPGYAFYAYKKSNEQAPDFDAKYVHSVDSFRDSSQPMLVYKSGTYLYNFSDQGRLSHHDGDLQWETVFSEWIKKIVRINV